MMSIEARKLAVIEFLLGLTDEKIIKKFEALATIQNQTSQEQKAQEFPPLTQQEIEGVKEALEQAKNGEVYSEEEIKNKFFK